MRLGKDLHRKQKIEKLLSSSPSQSSALMYFYKFATTLDRGC